MIFLSYLRCIHLQYLTYFLIVCTRLSIILLTYLYTRFKKKYTISLLQYLNFSMKLLSLKWSMYEKWYFLAASDSTVACVTGDRVSVNGDMLWDNTVNSLCPTIDNLCTEYQYTVTSMDEEGMPQESKLIELFSLILSLVQPKSLDICKR